MYCPYIEYQDTIAIPLSIRQANQQYLMNRLGGQFYNSRVTLRNVVVIDTSKLEEIQKTKGWINYSMCKSNVKYAFEYFFTIQDRTK